MGRREPVIPFTDEVAGSSPAINLRVGVTQLAECATPVLTPHPSGLQLHQRAEVSWLSSGAASRGVIPLPPTINGGWCNNSTAALIRLRSHVRWYQLQRWVDEVSLSSGYRRSHQPQASNLDCCGIARVFTPHPASTTSYCGGSTRPGYRFDSTPTFGAPHGVAVLATESGLTQYPPLKLPSRVDWNRLPTL